MRIILLNSFLLIYCTASIGCENSAGLILQISNLSRIGDVVDRKPALLYNYSTAIEPGKHVSGKLSSIDSNDCNKLYSKRNSNDREQAFVLTTADKSPHAVLLFGFNKDMERIGPPCSGSLVTRQWVVTAAYCLQPRVVRVRSISVYAGGNSVREFVRKQYALGSQVLNSSEFYVLSNYSVDLNTGVSFNDICILKTKEKFLLSDTINLVRLATKPWPSKKFRECEVTGFGKVYRQVPTIKDELRKTYFLKVRRPCYCLRNYNNKNGFEKLRNWICYGPHGNNGVCEGDFGAGLVCGGKLVGVMASIVFTEDSGSCKLIIPEFWECGRSNSFNIFQNIIPHIKWLNGHVKSLEEVSFPEEYRPRSCGNLPLSVFIVNLFCITMFLL